MARRGVWLSRLGVSAVCSAGITAICACYAPTEIDLTLATDVDCNVVRSNAVTIRTAADTPQLVDAPPVTDTRACTDGTSELGSLTVVPGSGSDEEVVVEVVLGVTRPTQDCHPPSDIGGCIVARRRLGFVKHTALKLPIKLERSCIGVPCGQDETCDRAACVSALVHDCPDGVCTVGTPAPAGGAGGAVADGGAIPDGGPATGGDAAPPPPPPGADASAPVDAANASDASARSWCYVDCVWYPSLQACQAGCSLPSSCSPIQKLCP